VDTFGFVSKSVQFGEKEYFVICFGQQ